MSSVTLDTSASALDQLRTINLMAQSTKSTTAGRIGLLNGKVVKFNTHLSERLFGPAKSQDMVQSCNDLRAHLCGLLKNVLTKPEDANLLAKLTSQIGEVGEGKQPTNLLNRSVVASVIKEVETALQKNDVVKMTREEYEEYCEGRDERPTTGCGSESKKAKFITVVINEKGFKAHTLQTKVEDLEKYASGKDASFKKLQNELPALIKSDYAIEELGAKAGEIEGNEWLSRKDPTQPVIDLIRTSCVGKDVRSAYGLAVNLYSEKSFLLGKLALTKKRSYLVLLEEMKRTILNYPSRGADKTDANGIYERKLRDLLEGQVAGYARRGKFPADIFGQLENVLDQVNNFYFRNLANGQTAVIDGKQVYVAS